MKAEFDITLTQQDMYRFNLYHAYKGTQGILSVIMSVLSFFLAVKTYGTIAWNYTFLYVAFGVLFLVYIPVALYLSTKRKFLTSEELRNALHYAVDETGIHTSQKDASADLPWEQVYKIVSNRHNILIYSNRINAYIIPREQIAEQYTAIYDIAKAQLPDYRFKMK